MQHTKQRAPTPKMLAFEEICEAFINLLLKIDVAPRVDFVCCNKNDSEEIAHWMVRDDTRSYEAPLRGR
jgi:hypothetical protein